MNEDLTVILVDGVKIWVSHELLVFNELLNLRHALIDFQEIQHVVVQVFFLCGVRNSCRVTNQYLYLLEFLQEAFIVLTPWYS